jgi:6-phosphogluconolactonase/glucosamine-6-phosphate isomerase/deaminase
VSFILTGLNYSKNPKYDTALQLYHLEREHSKISFSLKDIEKRFFSMDKQAAREKVLTRIALGNAVNSFKKGNPTKGARGKHNKNNKKSNASAHTVSHNKVIICYNCGEEGHIAPNCPHKKRDKSTYSSNKSVAKGRTAISTNDRLADDDALVCSA